MNRRKFTKIRHRGGQRGGFLNKLRTTYKKIRGKDTSNNKWYESQIKALKEKRAKKKKLYKEVKKTYDESLNCFKSIKPGPLDEHRKKKKKVYKYMRKKLKKAKKNLKHNIFSDKDKDSNEITIPKEVYQLVPDIDNFISDCYQWNDEEKKFKLNEEKADCQQLENTYKNWKIKDFINLRGQNQECHLKAWNDLVDKQDKLEHDYEHYTELAAKTLEPSITEKHHKIDASLEVDKNSNIRPMMIACRIGPEHFDKVVELARYVKKSLKNNNIEKLTDMMPNHKDEILKITPFLKLALTLALWSKGMVKAGIKGICATQKIKDWFSQNKPTPKETNLIKDINDVIDSVYEAFIKKTNPEGAGNTGEDTTPAAQGTGAGNLVEEVDPGQDTTPAAQGTGAGNLVEEVDPGADEKVKQVVSTRKVKALVKKFEPNPNEGNISGAGTGGGKRSKKRKSRSKNKRIRRTRKRRSLKKKKPKI